MTVNEFIKEHANERAKAAAVLADIITHLRYYRFRAA